jgi:hypothetical protein
VWVRAGLVATLAVPQVLIGAWAFLAPHSWFFSFPGFAPRLVAAEPPYNRHLVSDVGAGFLAIGIALLVAALWASRAGIRVALVAYVAFTVPHVVYHVGHPADALSGSENVLNVVALGSGLLLAAVFAWGVGRARDRTVALAA